MYHFASEILNIYRMITYIKHMPSCPFLMFKYMLNITCWHSDCMRNILPWDAYYIAMLCLTGEVFVFFPVCQMEIFKLQTLRWLQEGYLLFRNKQVTGKTCSCRLHVARVVRCARIPQHKGRMMVNYTKLETVIYKNIKVRSQKT